MKLDGEPGRFACFRLDKLGALGDAELDSGLDGMDGGRCVCTGLGRPRKEGIDVKHWRNAEGERVYRSLDVACRYRAMGHWNLGADSNARMWVLDLPDRLSHDCGSFVRFYPLTWGGVPS